MSALDPILASTHAELVRRKAARSPADLRSGAEAAADRRPALAFREILALDPAISVIAEHKRRSPSAGAIRADLALADVLGAYERAGAAAISVLTEPTAFGGSLDDLAQARSLVDLPLLRKDFLIDPYQVHEAVLAGADAVLLIVAALGPDLLRTLKIEAEAFGLATLVEVHDEREMAIAVDAGASLIGINNRDLETLEVDLATTPRLLPGVPADAVVVAESGFRSRAELEELHDAGVDAVLIGEALMRSPDVEAACRALLMGR